MKRRRLIAAASAGFAAGLPLSALHTQRSVVPRVGFLIAGDEVIE